MSVEEEGNKKMAKGQEPSTDKNSTIAKAPSPAHQRG